MTELVALLQRDAAFSMPPFPLWVQGHDDIVTFMTTTGAKCEGSKLVPTSANGGPAVGIYNPAEDGSFAPWAVVVVETSGGKISGLHHFIYPELFAVLRAARAARGRSGLTGRTAPAARRGSGAGRGPRAASRTARAASWSLASRSTQARSGRCAISPTHSSVPSSATTTSVAIGSMSLRRREAPKLTGDRSGVAAPRGRDRPPMILRAPRRL